MSASVTKGSNPCGERSLWPSPDLDMTEIARLPPHLRIFYPGLKESRDRVVVNEHMPPPFVDPHTDSQPSSRVSSANSAAENLEANVAPAVVPLTASNLQLLVEGLPFGAESDQVSEISFMPIQKASLDHHPGLSRDTGEFFLQDEVAQTAPFRKNGLPKVSKQGSGRSLESQHDSLRGPGTVSHVSTLYCRFVVVPDLIAQAGPELDFDFELESHLAMPAAKASMAGSPTARPPESSLSCVGIEASRDTPDLPPQVERYDHPDWTDGREGHSAMKYSMNFPCKYRTCIEGFNKTDQLERHMYQVHEFCEPCGLHFEDFEELHQHKLALPDRHITCPKCSQDFQTDGGLRLHVYQVSEHSL